MKIAVYNLNKHPLVNKVLIRRLIRKILKKERQNFANVNVIIADNKYLKNLNKRFFKKNRPTNVISFNMGDIGEIYISLNQVKEKKELYFYIAHGLLHIIGYNHQSKRAEKTMEKKCWEYLKRVK